MGCFANPQEEIDALKRMLKVICRGTEQVLLQRNTTTRIVQHKREQALLCTCSDARVLWEEGESSHV